ncbi:MAG: hypothetical protein A3J71_01580 [Pseudomonadales bacterium RIFCSPHIGHO2_02_FULL_60_43]|nr:MAG: hypothetical protein A3J71_01580 [Pseudomonadales bacterium RIFCSPHIGHO2_02_FULL_60_43]
MFVFEDSSTTQNLESILHPSQQALFKPFNKGFSGGYSRSVFWFRMQLTNTAANALRVDDAPLLLEIQPPYLDDLRLYLPDPRVPGGYKEVRGGDLLPSDERPYDYRSTVFRLPPEALHGGVLYLRLHTSSSSLLIAKLWNQKDFQSAKISEYGALGLYYGLLLNLILLMLWQGLWRKDRLFRAFLLYAGGIMLFMLGANGLASQFILPQHPWVGHYWTQYGSFLMYASGAYFYRLVLQIDARTPWLNRCYKLIQYSHLLLLPTPALGLYVEAAGLAVSLTLLMIALGTLRSIGLWRAGNRAAGLLILAHFTSLMGALSAGLALLGWLPGDLWLVHGFQIGSLASILACAQVMVWRVRAMEQQWHEEQLRALGFERQSRIEQQARHAQADFISLLSHEVRTPLAMIDGAVQSLQLMADMHHPEVQQRHSRIRRGVRRINGLLEHFLHSERLDEPDLRITPQWLECQALCNQLIQDQHIAQRVQLHVATPSVYADPQLAAIALGNLLSNAAKYSAADRPIELRLTRQGDWFCCEVNDRGCGIEDAYLPHIFQRFYRVPGGGDVDGSGLGLYMVQRIAELHGGQVNAEHREGGGMRFKLLLPYPEKATP